MQSAAKFNVQLLSEFRKKSKQRRGLFGVFTLRDPQNGIARATVERNHPVGGQKSTMKEQVTQNISLLSMSDVV
ncbi:MAG TPA: hypothetical protein VF799_11105 [Geobacteraceae bacterium]